MKFLAALGIASAIAVISSAPADARQGCGPGFHRTPNGMCRADRDNRYGRDNRMHRMAYVEGHYYGGHGYWYHSRWYQHRHRRNGVWIYL